jgi:hypothetical protein
MITNVLMVLHIAVLGYWLGSELVINSTFRYACFADDMTFAARDRLMGHVLDVDQHVRYALALQLVLGALLAGELGYIPGGATSMAIVAGLGALWLGFIEVAHRRRQQPAGAHLARFDRLSRYGLMLALAWVTLAGNDMWDWALPLWLRLKIGLFIGVMLCGVAIRFALIALFKAWRQLAADRPEPAAEQTIRRIYWQATRYLLVLWGLILAIVILSVVKPA